MQTHWQRKEAAGWGRGCHQSPSPPAAQRQRPFAPSPPPPPPTPLQAGPCHRQRPGASPTAGRARKRGLNSPGKDEELGGGKPKARSLPCPGSSLGPVPSSASAAGWARPGRLLAPLPLPAPPAACAAAGPWRLPAAAGPAGSRLLRPAGPGHVPRSCSFPFSWPGRSRCPPHGEPPERGAAAGTRIASHNLLRGRSESPPH